MIRTYDSVIIRVIATVTIPLIQVFALYIVTHGHYSPGGGFQGGVMLAASTLLLRMAWGSEESLRLFPIHWGTALAAWGVLIFLLTGVVAMLAGGNFLDYGALPIPGMEEAYRRYWGILVVEVGIGFAVWGALVAIYDALTGGGYEALGAAGSDSGGGRGGAR